MCCRLSTTTSTGGSVTLRDLWCGRGYLPVAIGYQEITVRHPGTSPVDPNEYVHAGVIGPQDVHLHPHQITGRAQRLQDLFPDDLLHPVAEVALGLIRSVRRVGHDGPRWSAACFWEARRAAGINGDARAAPRASAAALRLAPCQRTPERG